MSKKQRNNHMSPNVELETSLDIEKETVLPVSKPVVNNDESVDNNCKSEQPVHKKRIRHRQSVKLHNKKLSISVICSNPYIKQFS